MGQYVFGKFRDEAGNYVRVEIRELGGSGGDNFEEVTIRSLNANINGNPQEPYKPFSTTSGEITLSIHKNRYWQRRMVFDMLRAGDHGFGIHIYVSTHDDFDRISKPVFIGFIDITNLSYDDYPFPYDLKLKFYDGLASLRDIEFKTDSNPYEVGGIGWARSVHDMIFDCINCIPNIDVLIKDVSVPAVKVNCSWFATNMYRINGDLDNPLELVSVNPLKWIDIGKYTIKSVFDKAGKVLEDILTRFQLRIYFSGTTFIIEQMSERRDQTVIRHSYKLDGSNFFGTFAPGRGEIHDIEIDRVQVHRVATGGFGFFPAAKEVRINFKYTNDFSWVHTGDSYDFDSDTTALNSWVCSLITPKYNYDAANKRIGYIMRIRIKSDYLLAYENYAFVSRYLFAFKFLFNDDLVADAKYNNEFLESKKGWIDKRWVDAIDAERKAQGPITAGNPLSPDEISWIDDYALSWYDTGSYISRPSDIIRHQEWGQWTEVYLRGFTAPIPDDYKTGNHPLGVCFQLQGLIAQGRGNYLKVNATDYIAVPDNPQIQWWQGTGGDPAVFHVKYEVDEFAVFLADEDRRMITDTATRVYSGNISDKNKKVIEIDTEIGDGPGPLSVSTLRVINTNNDWVLPDAWTYSGVPGEHDIHELQVKELMRFYGEPRRMLTGKVWLKDSPETVNGAPFMYRFKYDNGIFLPIQVSYDFHTNILDGSLISVIGSYDTNVEVDIKEYEGVDSKLNMKGGGGGGEPTNVDPAAGLGVVQTTDKVGIDSAVNNGTTVNVIGLAIPPANYGYFNKGDQIQITDGNTGLQLIFEVDQDVLPDDETVQVVSKEVDIELGENATVMLYQEHFESQAYTDNRRKYHFEDIGVDTDRVEMVDFILPDKAIVSTLLIRKRLQVHLGSSKAYYGIGTYMGYDIDNVTNELVFNETIPAGEYVEVIYDGVRLEK